MSSKAGNNRLSNLIALDKEVLPADLKQNKKLVRKAQLNLLLSYML